MSAPPEPPPAEASPLWGLLLVLAEIAERVERERAECDTAEAEGGPDADGAS